MFGYICQKRACLENTHATKCPNIHLCEWSGFLRILKSLNSGRNIAQVWNHRRLHQFWKWSRFNSILFQTFLIWVEALNHDRRTVTLLLTSHESRRRRLGTCWRGTWQLLQGTHQSVETKEKSHCYKTQFNFKWTIGREKLNIFSESLQSSKAVPAQPFVWLEGWIHW